MDKKAQLKRLIMIIVISLVVFLIGKFLFQYVNSGTLSVKASGNGSITIVVKDKDGKEVIKSQTSEVKKRLYKGDYVVEVFNDRDGKSRASATVTARQATEQSLEIVDPLSPLLTSRVPASEINESRNGAYFLQTNSHLLKEYDEKSLTQPTIKTNLQLISKIDLSVGGSGYLMTSGRLIYRVDNNKTVNIRDNLLSDIKTLDIPRDIDYSPESGELFVSAGKNVYRVAGSEKRAEHIFTAPWPISKIAYSGKGNMLISQYPEESDSGNEEYGDPVVEKYSVSLLDTQTKKLTEIDKQPLLQSVDWSPSGRFLAYSVGNSLRVYDSLNNNYIRDLFLDNKIPSATNWCTDDKLIYSDGSGVWAYNSKKDQYSALLAKLSNVKALSCDRQETIYVGTYKQPRSGGLYRLATLDQSDKDLVNILNSASPFYGDKMMLDYVQTGDNKPTVVAKIFMPRDLLHVKKGQKGYLSAVVIKNQAKEEAKKYLNSHNIKPESVNLVYLVNY